MIFWTHKNVHICAILSIFNREGNRFLINFERMQYIIQTIQDNEVVYIKDLAKQFFRSESTIRRDMAVLEREGYIKRVHGGAVRIMHSDTHDIPYHVRTTDDVAIKRQIGKIAAGHVKNRMLIMMDTSSTTSFILPYLKQKDLRIISNSAQLVLQALNTIDGKVYCVGGKLDPYTLGFVGESARQGLLQWNADICFLSSRCVDLEHGCTDVSDEETVIKQTMIRQSAKVIYVADSSKFNKVSPRHLCRLEDLDGIITNKEPDGNWKATLQERNIRLQLCNPI